MKQNRKIHIAGIVTGALLLLAGGLGLSFAIDHVNLNVSLASNPGLTAIINNLALCSLIAGISGVVLLTISLAFFIRSSRSRSAAHPPGSSIPPGNTLP